VVIDVHRRKYVVGKLMASGEIADLYFCTEGKTASSLVLKLARSHRDNDLLQNEAQILRKLFPADAKDEGHRRYLLRLADSFLLRGTTGSQRRVNVLPVADGHVSVADVLTHYPSGIDYRDMAWMFRRLLDALGFVHSCGILHGSINPEHVLVHPTTHGAKLVDWCHGVADVTAKGARVRVMSTKQATYCAPEIRAKARVTTATDVYSAAACAVALLGGDPCSGSVPDTVPPQIRNFLVSCLLPAPTRRPDNAWDLHEEFAEVLRRLVGKPRYRPFHMPTEQLA
jgi:serine/threonine protein kinase